MRFPATFAATAAYTSLASAVWLQSNGSHFVDPYSKETLQHFGCGTRFGHGSHDFNQTLHRLQKAQKEHGGGKKHGGTRRPGAALLGVRQTVPKPITVPTYFHVVQSAAKAGTITDQMATDQAAALNKAYNPYGISFTLQGTDFTTNDAWAAAAGPDMDAAKQALRKGSYAALNIYFHTDFAGGNLGTCSLPSTVPAGADATLYASDGCNVNADTMPGGKLAGYNMGGTAIHETGHWLGLLHTFEGYSCEGPGDYIDDTPAQSTATNGCPAKPPKDSCPSRTGVDPIHNYMDYSTDACYEGFTPLQIQRIGNMWQQYRAGM